MSGRLSGETNTTPMVDCGVCGRIHENLRGLDCRAFRACTRCGDGYGGEKRVAGRLSDCDGMPSVNVMGESVKDGGKGSGT